MYTWFNNPANLLLEYFLKVKIKVVLIEKTRNIPFEETIEKRKNDDLLWFSDSYFKWEIFWLKIF